MPLPEQDVQLVVAERTASLTDEVEPHWTAEAMARARSIEPEVDDEEILTLMGPRAWVQDGDPTVMESVPADGSVMGDDVDIADTRDSFITTRVPTGSLDDFPYSAIGKLFMTFDGQDFVGSAWVVAETAVFTAAHCVFDVERGRWADNILFVPQFNAGTTPVGDWTARLIVALEGWTQQRKFEYDLAAFVTDRPIRPATGSLGWMANHAPNQGPYKAVGYPSQPLPGFRFDGRRVWQSIGGYIQGTNPVQMHNNMTGGCSGGPWIVARNRNVYANGLNSFRYNGQPTTLYSPYFGDAFLKIYEKVK